MRFAACRLVRRPVPTMAMLSSLRDFFAEARRSLVRVFVRRYSNVSILIGRKRGGKIAVLHIEGSGLNGVFLPAPKAGL